MIRLALAPGFNAVRTQSGAITADSATINDTNYPITLGFAPGRASPSIVVAREASGTISQTDYLDRQKLIRAGKGLTARWLEGDTQLGVRHAQIVRFPTYGSSVVALRIVAVSCPSGTDLIVGAAQYYVL